MDAIVTAQHNYQTSVVDEILTGLRHKHKFISPKFFYDQNGSELFSQIMQLPEYYLTRTEAAILQQNSEEIAHFTGRNNLLIEPGAGNCEKITYLLDALRPRAFFPQDISHEFLSQTARQLKQSFDWLEIVPISGDFQDEIIIPDDYPETRRIVFYPGSTIGNFKPEVAANFLSRMVKLVGHDGGLIIGVDLQKDVQILNAAYNDKQGVTARFNLNILEHINTITGAEFNLSNFTHEAFYNPLKQRIEMHLRSVTKQEVWIGDEVIHLAEGETIHTENSYKYTLLSFSELVNSVGLKIDKTWQDEQQLFSVHYLSVK